MEEKSHIRDTERAGVSHGIPYAAFAEPHDPPFDHMPSGLAPDDPHTRQVPEPGLTLMMLAGGAVWARRRWKR